ncbi:MAG: 4Fe-4S binding protein [Christensenellales bacterium]
MVSFLTSAIRLILFETALPLAKQRETAGYYVGEGCIGCKLCYAVCPQKCIDITPKPVVIIQRHCLHCGRCAEICPKQVIEKRF